MIRNFLFLFCLLFSYVHVYSYVIFQTELGKNLHWEDDINITVDPSVEQYFAEYGLDFITTLEEALDIWTDQAGLPLSFRITRENCYPIISETSGIDAGRQDRINCIAKVNKENKREPGASATTYIMAGTKSGRINEADIAFYDCIYPLDDFILKRSLIHELGHVWGLAHSDNPDSIMDENIFIYDQEIYDLYPDDIAGIKKLYKNWEKTDNTGISSCSVLPANSKAKNNYVRLIFNLIGQPF